MDGKSLNIQQNNIEILRELFPNIFSEGKVDLEKVRATFCDEPDFKNERYTLNWAGKADAFKILQERTSATLKPQPELSVNFDNTDNIFIEGENLEVLKVLQKSYYNKIKCIIIDPPYNTGNDSFIYPDRFKENLEDYEKRIGEKDEEGYLMKEGLFRKNSRENGHYHSNWLNMMLPRLFLARNLLSDDGVIFVHIDDNEVHNLRLLMNEIFGEENFVGCFIWRKKEGGGQTDEYFVTEHEYILVFKKRDFFEWQDTIVEDDERNYTLDDEKGKYKIVKLAKWGSSARKEDRPTMHFPIINPDQEEVFPKAPDGSDGRWRVGKARMDSLIENDLIHWESTADVYIPYEKIYFESGKGKTNKDRSILYNVANTGDGTKALIELFGVKDIFDNPKPIELLQKLVENNVDDKEIVCDFFGGSSSLAHAVLVQNKKDGKNRKFVIVQLPEETKENSVAKLNGYKTIADLSRERIRRVIQKNGGEAGFKSFKLSPSNFKVWRSEDITEENLEQQMEMFIDPVKPESQTENMLIELMLKSGYQLTDKVENKGNYYCINDNELVIALTKMDLEIATEIIALQPKKVIALDRLFSGNDELKTNTALQMRDAGVEFRTI